MAAPEIPAPPQHLSERSARLWSEVVAAYEFAPQQFELLQRACEAADRADEARDLLSEQGLTVTDRYGQVKPHPAAAIERDSRIAEARLFRELALEPGPVEADPRPPRPGTAGTARKRK